MMNHLTAGWRAASGYLAPTALLGCVLMASCTPGETQVEAGNRDGILHWNNGSEPQGLDLQVATGVPENHLFQALCEGLVMPSPTSADPAPGFALRWEKFERGQRWVFHLNPEAKWSNGDAMTAHDVVWSWQRILMPALGSQYQHMLYPVLNAEAFYKQEIDDFSEVGVKALDDHTLEIRLEFPAEWFLQTLIHYSTWPVHKGTILKFGAMDERDTLWTREENFVCNGAFRLKKWRVNDRIVVDRNPHYWDAKTVQLNEVHYYPVENESSEEFMFRAGQLHITNVVPLDKIEVYEKEHPEMLRIDPYLGTYFYRLNTTRPPLNNRLVRHALALSLDRESIIKNITRGGELEAYSFTPPGVAGYQPPTSIGYDLDKAGELLAEAGYPNGEGFPEIELLYNTQEGHRAIALAVQQMWQKLGISVVLTNQEWKVYLDRQRTLNFDVIRAGWIGDYIDPFTFLGEMQTGLGNNNTGWGNSTYDRLVNAANEAPDAETRYQLLGQAEDILIDAMPIIPVYTYTRKFLIRPEVKGWNPHYLDQHPLKHISLVPDAASTNQ